MRMRSNIKRIGAAAAAALLALSMSLTAFAAPEGEDAGDKSTATGTLQITTTGDRTGAEFTIYPVMTFHAEKDGQGKLVYTNVTVVPEFEQAVKDAGGLDEVSKLESTDPEKPAPSSLVAKFSNLLVQTANKPAGTVYTIGDGAISLPHGYYLIEETKEASGNVGVKSSPILVAVPSDTDNSLVSVTVKSSKPDISKEIVSGDSSLSNAAAIGDTVNFQLKSVIPIYGVDIADDAIVYKITDTLSDGLDYNSDIKISLGNEVLYSAKDNINVFGEEIITAPSEENNVLIIDLSKKLGTSVNGKTIREYAEDENGAQFIIEYSATLNAKEQLGNSGNENSVVLEYESQHETDTKVTKTYTTALKVIKYEKSAGGTNTTTGLPGAKFKLQKQAEDGSFIDLVDAQGDVVEKETDASGVLSFDGLDMGTYHLIETQAPAGYSLDTTPYEFTVSFKPGEGTTSGEWTGTGSKDNQGNVIFTIEEAADGPEGTFQTTIYNAKGITLPGTGGIGTTIFKIAGGSLILLACAMLFVYYKKRGHENK